MRASGYKEKVHVVRILHWAVIIYLLIAVLHGAVPAIWHHHVEKGDQDGPFRLLLFTPLLLMALPAFLPALQRRLTRLSEFAMCVFVRPEYLIVWTLRGPPSFQRGAR